MVMDSNDDDDDDLKALFRLMMVKFDHVVLLMIQIQGEFLHVLTIVIQFSVRDHEFSPTKANNRQMLSKI